MRDTTNVTSGHAAKKMTRSRLQSKLNGMFLRLGALRLANLKLHNFLKLFSVYLTNKLKNRAHRKDGKIGENAFS